MRELIAQFQNGTGIIDIVKDQVRELNGILTAEIGFWSKVTDFIKGFGYWAYIVMALGLIVAFFGKKLLPIFKFVGFLGAGFAGGVLFLSPYITFIPAWVTGLVIGIIAAIFCKIFYYLAVAGAVGGAVYYICWAAPLAERFAFTTYLTNYTEGKWYFCAIAAAVAVLVVFLLLKWLEMLGTAVVGSFFFTICLNAVTSFLSLGFIQGYENIVKWAVVGVVALIGFIIQVKTRRRY